jgi:hypothetical protein
MADGCLTTKTCSAVGNARAFGRFAQEVGARFSAISIVDLQDLDWEELEAFSRLVYRARSSLKKLRAFDEGHPMRK